MGSITATDPDGNRLRTPRLGARLASGGEGAIHEDLERDDVVLKLFHQPSSRAHQKVRAMLLHQPASQLDFHGAARIVQIAWPQEILVAEGGTFCGFSMRRVDIASTVPLNAWFNREARSYNKLTGDDRIRVYLAHNLSAVVEFIHRVGHAIVDIKPENIHAYREGGFVCLLDCDGFSVRHGEQVYPAGVATRPYTAPEHLAGTWAPHTFGQAQDNFGLAVMIFMLLNDGRHPSDGTSAGPPNDRAGRLEKGLFFLDPASGLTAPRASQHEFWPTETLAFFRRAFGPPADRPLPSEWRAHLRNLIGRMIQCGRNAEHWHFGRGCPWCELQQRRGSRPVVQGPPIQVQAPPTAVRPGVAAARVVTPPPVHLSPAPAKAAPSSKPPVIRRSRKPASLGLPGWAKLYGWIGLAILFVAYLQTERKPSVTAAPTAYSTPQRPAKEAAVRASAPAPAPSPTSPSRITPSALPPSSPVALTPPTPASSSLPTAIAAPPRTLPPASVSPPSSPASVPGFSPTLGVASIQAVLRQLPQANASEISRLDRATLMEQLDSTDSHVKVRTSGGLTGWLSKEVVIDAINVRRLYGLSPQQYVDKQAPEARMTAVLRQAMRAQGPLSAIHDQVAKRSPSVMALLERLSFSGGYEIETDMAAGSWFGWAARLAERQRNFSGSFVNSQAALSANPLDPEHYQRAGLSAHYLGDAPSVQAVANVLPYLSPKSTTTWAIVGIALANDPAAAFESATGAFWLMFRLTSDQTAVRALLKEISESAVNQRVRRAVAQALADEALATAWTPVDSSRPRVPREPQRPTREPQAANPMNPVDRRNLASLLQAGEAQLALGNFAQAKANANAILLIAPNDLQARTLLASAQEAERQAIARIQVR